MSTVSKVIWSFEILVIINSINRKQLRIQMKRTFAFQKLRNVWTHSFIYCKTCRKIPTPTGGRIGKIISSLLGY